MRLRWVSSHAHLGDLGERRPFLQAPGQQADGLEHPQGNCRQDSST